MTEAGAAQAGSTEAGPSQADKAARFLSLHDGPTPLLMPNPWDAGSARLLDWLGFEALATTSSGFAATLGRLDGSVSREEALAHAASIVTATDRPVSADLENCFADDPGGVAATVRLAVDTGLAGCSVEDFSRRPDDPIYDTGLAAERVAAATEAAHVGPVHFVITARAENYVHGRRDLADTIARLQAYQEAGADVLFAPGLSDLEDVRQVVASVDRPVNVLPLAGRSNGGAARRGGRPAHLGGRGVRVRRAGQCGRRGPRTARAGYLWVPRAIPHRADGGKGRVRRWRGGPTMTDGTTAATAIFDDLEAEQERLEAILDGLDAAAWRSPSAAEGWSVADVVLHLAQTEDAVVVSAAGGDGFDLMRPESTGVDDAAERMVQAERAEPAVVFERWKAGRRAALAALRTADPQKPIPWVATRLKPATLATTRLAEHWAHGLDITGPLGAPLPDTDRLRHIAWLAHGTLPYAFALASQEAHPVYCELVGPSGDIWRYGPTDADSTITGPAGAFCRVGAQRLAPQDSGLLAEGPNGQAALRVLRTYAG